MKVLRFLAIVFAWLSAPLLTIAQGQGGIEKPQVIPAFIEEKAPAFLLECRNTTGGAIRPIPQDLLRIDGEVRSTGGYATTGPEAPLIAPGGSWSEVVVLHTSTSGTTRSPSFGAIRRRDIVVELTTGRHTIEFQCGGRWSGESAFYWDEGSH